MGGWDSHSSRRRGALAKRAHIHHHRVVFALDLFDILHTQSPFDEELYSLIVWKTLTKKGVWEKTEDAELTMTE